MASKGVLILGGLPVGRREADERFTPGSVNRRVEDRLIAMAARRLELGEAVRLSDQTQ